MLARITINVSLPYEILSGLTIVKVAAALQSKLTGREWYPAVKKDTLSIE